MPICTRRSTAPNRRVYDIALSVTDWHLGGTALLSSVRPLVTGTRGSLLLPHRCLLAS